MPTDNDPCPCGSRRTATDCCLTSGGYWHKTAAVVTPPAPVTAYANPKCYAASLRDCASKVCREHFISENVLKQIAKSGKAKVAGFPWQQPQVFDALPTNALASKVLCTRHGAALSPLDAEFGRFFSTLEEIDDALRDGKASAFRLFSGENIERWMLKMLLGAVSSENFKSQLKEECLGLLYAQRPWPEGWGLYLEADPGAVAYHSDSLAIETGLNPQTSTVLAAKFVIRGLPFTLALGKPDEPAKVGIFRPRRIEFACGRLQWTIELSWPDQQLQHSCRLERVGNYDGPPPNWQEWERNG